MRLDTRRVRWGVSSLFYRFSYVRIAHQVDEDLFSYLADSTEGAVVADCGCGPGVTAAKFLERGAEQVFAVDLAPGMLRQAADLLDEPLKAGKVELVRRSFDDWFNQDLPRLDGRGPIFDIILFKRSLYNKRERAVPLLREALKFLKPRGVLAIIHPERSLLKYCFGPGLMPQRHTLYHLFNRTWSSVGTMLGIGEYTVHAQAELVELAKEAAGGRKVRVIPSHQQSYNLIAITS